MSAQFGSRPMKSEYPYHKYRKHAEWQRIVRTLVPQGVTRLRLYLRYRRWFPEAFIDGGCSVARTADIGSGCVLQGCTVHDAVSLGAFTTLGKGTVLRGRGKVSVGRFCSIASECFILSENHSHSSCTTYPLSHMVGGEAPSNNYPAAPITIGNDVWIGHRCTILAGATIGDGCVVAAGSVVTNKQHPSYAILAGVPARVVGYRFSDAVKDKLLADRWWEADPDVIFSKLRDELEAPPSE